MRFRLFMRFKKREIPVLKTSDWDELLADLEQRKEQVVEDHEPTQIVLVIEP